MITELCAAALVAAFSAFLLRHLGWRGAPVFAALCFIFLISTLSRNFSDIIKIFDTAAIGDSAAAILKIIGIGYLFGISSELCRELGESSIASALSLLGRFEIIAVVLPFISELISLALSLTEHM